MSRRWTVRNFRGSSDGRKRRGNAAEATTIALQICPTPQPKCPSGRRQRQLAPGCLLHLAWDALRGLPAAWCRTGGKGGRGSGPRPNTKKRPHGRKRLAPGPAASMRTGSASGAAPGKLTWPRRPCRLCCAARSSTSLADLRPTACNARAALVEAKSEVTRLASWSSARGGHTPSCCPFPR